MHTVAHSTKLSFTPKTNSQLIKKFFRLAVIWVKVIENGKILTFKVNFLCQKLSKSFYFFHWRTSISEDMFWYWHILKTSIFKPFYFLKWCPIFDDFYSTERKKKDFLRGWSLVLGRKECLVVCAKLCVKSEVMLKRKRQS